jgi:hypothetical protein
MRFYMVCGKGESGGIMAAGKGKTRSLKWGFLPKTGRFYAH